MYAQAVSKREMDAGYPDVALLPVIAAYFGVSLDVLFDYDADYIKEKITQILITKKQKRSSSLCHTFTI